MIRAYENSVKIIVKPHHFELGHSKATLCIGKQINLLSLLFKSIKKINYPMLADPTHALSRDFEVLIEADGMAERGTFIVNPLGKIVSYEVSAGNVGRNADELFRKLQACQFVYEHGDEVCPAKWQPGAQTLKPSLDLVGML